MTVFVLGGAQTDFARRWSREEKDLFDGMGEALRAGAERARVELGEVDVTHVGNFVGERFRGQGHLGGLVASLDPALRGKPSSRHEAACASGSVAALAAMADLEAGYYDLACVLGVEEMRNVPGDEAAAHLGAAAWVGREAEGARYVWPFLFSELLEHVDRAHGVKGEHLWAFAKQAFENARRNPDAQTRRWTFGDASFTADREANPPIEGRLRRQDCAQITDGAAAVFFAAERFASAWAKRRGVDLEAVPRLLGWGHRVGPMSLQEKLDEGGAYLFPHVKDAVDHARRRAEVADVGGVDAIELHDCFTITAYALIEHLGITAPGRAFEAIEDGSIALGGRIPVNPIGGLIGLGHPVGATGVRMLVDAWRQTTGQAGEMQVEGARRVQTLNIGGSATTAVSFLVGT
ncbi:MAG TPA: acetyl-CoA acetyltransferase [Polyangiaceae bacterium LLY-WYZ-15_(1-7)]|nr:acetyl-CoA acetyltransferase [Polyangiaceae bacterium LLY-WYZ-15_(1-7)]